MRCVSSEARHLSRSPDLTPLLGRLCMKSTGVGSTAPNMLKSQGRNNLRYPQVKQIKETEVVNVRPLKMGDYQAQEGRP